MAQSGSPIQTITASDESRQHPDIARMSLEYEGTIVSTRRANVACGYHHVRMRSGSATPSSWSPRWNPIHGCGAGIRRPSWADILGDRASGWSAVRREVPLADGDRLVIRESVPSSWEPPRPTALLVHGLAGSADASYVVRVGRRLSALGVRVVRVNLRGAGEGFGLARGIYHAGRSDDLRQVVDDLEARTPGSPITLIGFSLGANLVLKLAAEAAAVPLRSLDCVLAANPPIDLAGCARLMLRPENRLYDWNFVRWLARW